MVCALETHRSASSSRENACFKSLKRPDCIADIQLQINMVRNHHRLPAFPERCLPHLPWALIHGARNNLAVTEELCDDRCGSRLQCHEAS